MLLEDHSCLSAVFPQCAAALENRTQAFDDDVAAGGLDQSVQASKQRRLAGARGPKQHEELAPGNGDAGWHHRCNTIRVRHCNILQLQHRRLPRRQIKPPFAGVLIEFFEQMMRLFDNADLATASDTQMTAPTPARSAMCRLKIERIVQNNCEERQRRFASRARQNSRRTRRVLQAYGFAGWMKAQGLTSESLGTSMSMR